MAYDVAHREVVLFGGVSAKAGGGNEYPDDLWTWNGSRWRQIALRKDAPHPPGRDAPSLVYDQARSRLVLFGGRGPGDGIADWEQVVWEWDGARWYRIVPPAYDRVLHPTVTYDPLRRRVVRWGGGLLTATGGFNGLSRATQEWDGARWTLRDDLAPANHYAQAGWVTPTGELTLWLTPLPAGPPDTVAPAASRIWKFNGSSRTASWTEGEPGPPFNNLQAAVAASDGTLYFYQAWEGTWLPQPVMHIRTPSGMWSQVTFADKESPGVRNTQAAAWDSARSRFVLFGGRLRSGELLGDTWEFDGRTWVRRAP